MAASPGGGLWLAQFAGYSLLASRVYSSDRFLFPIMFNRIKAEKIYILDIPVPLHYVLLIFLAGAVLYGWNRWRNRDKWTTLVHEQYSFSVDYPANWMRHVYGEGGSKNQHDLRAQTYTNLVGPLGPVSKSLRVYWTLMEGPTLAQAAEWGMEKLLPPSPYDKGVVSDLEETTVGAGNYPALTRTFAYDDSTYEYAGSSPIRIHYYVVHDNDVYLLDFYLSNANNMDEAAPIIEHMLASFRIIN